MQQALVFIIATLSQLYLFVMLIRLWLPWLGGDLQSTSEDVTNVAAVGISSLVSSSSSSSPPLPPAAAKTAASPKRQARPSGAKPWP